MDEKELKYASEGERGEEKAETDGSQGVVKERFEPPRLVVHGEVKELTAGTFGASV